MPRYREMFRKMLSENETVFKNFLAIHDQYKTDKKRFQDEFNRQGAIVLGIIHDYERQLCGKTERGNNAVFSSNLAEKFHAEIKAFFPLVDFIGVKIQ